jgi:hypothetical protein
MPLPAEPFEPLSLGRMSHARSIHNGRLWAVQSGRLWVAQTTLQPPTLSPPGATTLSKLKALTSYLPAYARGGSDSLFVGHGSILH